MTDVLPDAPWRHDEGLKPLLIALGGEAGETRFVGGAVRDTFANRPVSDIDLATIHTPQEVMTRLKAADIKAVPTGIDHGTITAVIQSRPYEVTTLRSDVSTDGRRATVAFSQDWQADAARRDFTINALYAHTSTGAVQDYFGGLQDLAGRKVRFIGDANARIAEDHLRILRYFRFFARYGGQEPDAVALAACITHAKSLMALSRERVADELLKLLAAPDPSHALKLMIEGNILCAVLPEITAEGVENLGRLLTRESVCTVAPSPLLRLCALLPHDASVGETIAARLKMSGKARKRMVQALSPFPTYSSPKELIYRLGMQAAQDIILLDPARDPSHITALTDWVAPQMPVGGAMLMDMGMKSGPLIARALLAIKDIWVAENFPDPDRAYAIARQVVAEQMAAERSSEASQ